MKTTLIERNDTMISATMDMAIIGTYPDIDPEADWVEHSWESVNQPFTVKNKAEAMEKMKGYHYNSDTIPDIDLPWNSITRLEICIGLGFSNMFRDSDAIIRSVKAAYGILKACEARNVPGEMAFTFSYMEKGKVIPEDLIWGVIADLSLPEELWLIFQHRDMFRFALIHGEGADLECHHLFQSADNSRSSVGTTFPSVDGGKAVEWAKTFRGASHVIAIGNILDKQDAILVLEI